MDAQDLYGLPLDRFVPQRGALARALRADGRRDEAAEVAGLRKPSVAAWAVNQLVRTRGRAVKGLLDAGDALRGAHSDLLAGRGDGGALRAAGERERAAVGELVDSARGLLSSEGHELSDTVLERVADTLHAAALDEDKRGQVRDGCLTRELRHVGLGVGETAAAPPTGKRKGAVKAPATGKRATAEAGKTTVKATDKAAKVAAERERERAARQRADAEAAAERERKEARKAARSAESAARRTADRAARALRTAEERRERAAQSLREADETLAAAQAEADEAAEAQRRAADELERL